MHSLTLEQRKKVESTLEPVVVGKDVLAICAYGSQIAGYARGDSDYDVIVVMNPFPQRIKYFYLHGDVDCSALVVNPVSFEKDCQKSSLGEFASGRLLNAYEALVGKDYLRENEVAFKKRVILEGLAEAYAENLQFASELDFYMPYFLFEKLRKRAAIYPPVVYSYSQTYGEQLRESNLEASLVGFRIAAKQLSEVGIINYDESNDKVKIVPQKFKGGFSARLEVAASYTTKSLRQYAVHGYAGRVGPKVLGKEVFSKLSRSRTHSKLSEEIHSPKNYWGISDGKLFIDSTDWLSDLQEIYGLDTTACRVSQKSLGEFYNTASFFTLEDGKNRLDIAVKRFKDIKGMKWGLLNLWALRNSNFTANAAERMYREYRAIRELKRIGLNTTEVLAVFLAQRMLVTRFIQGKDLSKIESSYLSEETDDLSAIHDFGKILATMHNNGFCMGDSKPSNAILSDTDSQVHLTDLEQTHTNGNPVWDLAEFIYYSVRFTLKEDRARKLVNAFVQGYLERSTDSKIVTQTLALRYRAPFQAFIAPNILSALRNDLHKAN